MEKHGPRPKIASADSVLPVCSPFVVGHRLTSGRLRTGRRMGDACVASAHRTQFCGSGFPRVGYSRSTIDTWPRATHASPLHRFIGAWTLRYRFLWRSSWQICGSFRGVVRGQLVRRCVHLVVFIGRRITDRPLSARSGLTGASAFPFAPAHNRRKSEKSAVQDSPVSGVGVDGRRGRHR